MSKHLQIKNLRQNEQDALVDLVKFLGTKTTSKAVIEAVTSHRYLATRVQDQDLDIRLLRKELYDLKLAVNHVADSQDRLNRLASDNS